MRWTKEEEKYLKENYKTMFYLEIARCLNRTYKSINHKAWRIGLKSGWRTRITDRKKENNGNWKGGIGKDNYRYKKIQQMRYPIKVKAREKLCSALLSSRISKPDCCQNCGLKKERKEIHGHHENYDKPLEVIWLCRKCHRKIHQK